MRNIIPTLFAAVVFIGCGEGLLEEEVYSEFSPGNFLVTEPGLQSALMGAYAELQVDTWNHRNVHLMFNELPTDIMLETGGGLQRHATIYMDFQWDASHNWLQGWWSKMYQAIRNANIVLDNLAAADVPEETRQLFEAEARFVRAKAYAELYDMWGAVPLITTSDLEETSVPRASEEEIQRFIEEEFRTAAQHLPVVHPVYGRATKGAALGFLARFLLNTKQWQKAADAAQEVMELGVYELFEDRYALFDVENEINSEFIYVTPAVALAGEGNVYIPHAFPPGYAYKYPPNENFGAQFKTPTAFLNTFHPDDERKEHIITEYVNTDGELVQLGEDDARSLKYHEDPAATDRFAGNDIVELRYAEILLIRAEALNELEGPNAESIALINRVREVAGVPLISLSDFPSKEALRDHILTERGWEFFTEGKRRPDLIRMEKFIENARARGKAAEPYHVLFPIPQAEVDANSSIEQNPGY